MSRAVAAGTPDLEHQLQQLGRPVGPRRPLRFGRSHIVALVLVVAAVWLVAVFAGTLSDLDHATQRRQAVVDESAALQQRLDADRRELLVVQTDAFQRMQARAYGIGEPGEQAFSLEADAPSPEPIIPLGQTQAAPEQSTPLDSWLELLFGS